MSAEKIIGVLAVAKDRYPLCPDTKPDATVRFNKKEFGLVVPFNETAVKAE